VSYDLYGCVQVLITPPASNDKLHDNFWFDINRVDFGAVNERVLPLPKFAVKFKDNSGPADKPSQ